MGEINRVQENEEVDKTVRGTRVVLRAYLDSNGFIYLWLSVKLKSDLVPVHITIYHNSMIPQRLVINNNMRCEFKINT